MELLSPAGNYLACIGAINAGADAVYLGGSKYGARAYAENFSDEEIFKAIEYAHLFNVKIYLTVNTLIKEREWEDCISYIRPFYEAGLDAVIVQDLGLISVFKSYFPNMECHISTQGFATGLESVRFYKKLGADRVVLARELSLDEIKKIKQSEDIELETFIHGAMCYSYSGQCLFSSCLGGRSGNRGRCAGPCRLPYKLVSKDFNAGKEAYYLSMKDQCTLEILPYLIDAGIDSLKIEGRMKKPEYSAFVTSVYRHYIDSYLVNPSDYKVLEKDLSDLKKIYLRSEIKDGYYFCQNGKEMLTLSSPGYIGSEDSLMEDIRKKYLSASKKISVDAFFHAEIGKALSLVLSDKNGNTVTSTGPVCEKSEKHPATSSDIKKQISKLGDTEFILDCFDANIDGNCFLPVKILNEIRRDAADKLKKLLLQKMSRASSSFCTDNMFRERIDFEKKPIISITTKEQFDCINEYLEDCYIALPYELLKGLYGTKKDFFVNLPFVTRQKDYRILDEIYDFILHNDVAGAIVNNYEEINRFADLGKILIFGNAIYGFNKEAVSCISSFSDSFVLPAELNSHEIDDLEYNECYLNVYGKIPLMKTANCIVKTCMGCHKNSGNLFVYIRDRKNTDFSVMRDCDFCYNVIYNSVPTFIENNGEFNLYISFTDEKKEEVIKIMDYYFRVSNNPPEKYTKGYWKRGIE